MIAQQRSVNTVTKNASCWLVVKFEAEVIINSPVERLIAKYCPSSEYPNEIKSTHPNKD